MFERASKNDDKFALAHARLDEAYAELDYSEKAGEEILNAGWASESARLASLDRLQFKRSPIRAPSIRAAVQSYNEMSAVAGSRKSPRIC